MWKRLKVVVSAFAIGLALSLFCAMRAPLNPAAPHPSPLVLFGPAAGPFAEPLARVDYSPPRMALWAGVLLAVIALHPCWPNAQTGVVSGVAIGIWFLVGFS